MKMLMLWLSFSFVLLFQTSIVAKECANVFASHSIKNKLFTTAANSSLLNDYHLNTPTEESIHSNHIYGGKMDWGLLYSNIKNNERVAADSSLKEVSLHDVRLDPDSIHGHAQQTNLEYLLLINVDRLVWSFRKTAGLSTPGHPYGGWEAPNVEIRGHFVGHYLSATAQTWASTHNTTLYTKMNAVISALYECQAKIGTGYLSAFPPELFDRLESLKPVWAPYYTIHKIMAGLLDQYSFTANSRALDMVIYIAEYITVRVEKLITKMTVERHYNSLNTEYGGMNDIFYRLYKITGNEKHLVMGTLFEKPCFLGILAVQADSLSHFHTNTHIPIVIGSLMRYELTGDPLFQKIGKYFMQVVNSSHCYATGGTSVREYWSDPKRLADTLETENQESSTTYNMLKVSRHLFRWTKEMAYADYYERALTNGVLSIQRGREPGVMIYMLPLGRGASKAQSYHGWGTKFESFWGCYGTGIESFSKLGDSIYFETYGNELYIIQFISSSFYWKSRGIVINQKVEPVSSWDHVLRVTLNFSAHKWTDEPSALNVRIPTWTNSGALAKLNDEELFLPAPGNFLSVNRKWRYGDHLTLELPMSIRTESLKDDRPEYASIHAILYGPYVLVGLSNGDWDLDARPDTSLLYWIDAIPASHNSQLVTLSQQSKNETFVMTLSNNSITLETMPESGTTSAIHATFRFVTKDTDPSHSFSESVMIEPFDLPGMLVVHQGRDENLTIANNDGTMRSSSVFRVVEGLDKKGTVSLESESQKGCFLYSRVFAVEDSRANIKLSCQSAGSTSDAYFQQATSFKLEKGLSEYHPISFVAKGSKKNFILMPLLSLKDETYTVYFNFKA
ncbi:hypothetical protein AQUCO_00900257v1 [Aquilegia coerulea]|uniref:Alpha-L-arabinofuranosidase B arabinose-binding domain-containing protein n=1 Tax=Aquilegia coerulea TaxID=218851 RepID=A0A2G5ECR1_AQUCA|nr:hypothetical protein AQUCO_00900257v1 [Aquilegia coerulea]